MFDPEIWARVPFHFWSVVFFAFGSVVGSFLNVCIHRMPRNESIVSPPSHCPHCKYSIPWFLNVPLVTWLYLRGKCANCRAPISIRYFLVELLTGVLFLACWLKFGEQSALLALAYCILLAGFVVATFIDFEHFIIPDEITLGGIAVGIVVSFFVPELHGEKLISKGMQQGVLGAIVGGGMIYAVLRGGKLLFGKLKIKLEPKTKVFFTETDLVLPEGLYPYEEIFYRDSDVITMQAKQIEVIDRCYLEATVRLTPKQLTIGEETFDPEQVKHMEAIADDLTLPREAMGFGDVKFMAAIGAFLGWQATVFSLMASSVVGTLFVAVLALRGKLKSGRIYFGPFIAVGATVWIFFGREIMDWWLGRLQ
ncbi:MAG: Peptidase domain protein [Verrucomicrobiales bacterium]|nr:Peptidase domain protein [Verrucomicrobiales bacterium]